MKNDKSCKGSKLMMQFVASQSNHIIETILCDSLEWISPRVEDGYKEYQLNNSYICNYLGLDKNKKEIFYFWPSRQPQWDGLALGKSGTLYLFEAKSHLSETYSNLHSSSEVGKKLITRTICEIASETYHVKDKCTIDNFWLKRNYQIANRLVFLHKMRENIPNFTKFNNVSLVFLNFLNDWTIGDKCVKDANDWEGHYKKIFGPMQMRINQIVIDEGVLIINYIAPINN